MKKLWLLLGLLLFLPVSVSAIFFDPYIWFSFEDMDVSTVLDNVGYVNGTLIGDYVVNTSDCILGSCGKPSGLDADAGVFFNLSDETQISGDVNFSIAYWWKEGQHVLWGFPFKMIHFDFGDTPTNDYKFGFYRPGTVPTYHLNLSGGTFIEWSDTAIIDEPDDEWTHFVISYNTTSKEHTLYVDGQRMTNTTNNRITANFSLDDSAYFNTYGPIDEGVYHALNTSVDQILVFNRTLSEQDAIDLYNSGSGTDYHNQGIEIGVLDEYSNYWNSVEIYINDIKQTSNPATFDWGLIMGQNNSGDVRLSYLSTIDGFDTTNLTLTVNRGNSSHNYTEESTNIQLNFNQDGSPILVNGSVTQSNFTLGFSDSSVVIIQNLNVSEGITLVKFNNLEYPFPSGNHTQFYEFINDLDLSINESIEIFDTADVLLYFQVTTSTGSVIKDAELRLFCNTPLVDQSVPLLFSGQRLTQDSGLTFFYLDSGDDCSVIISKEGFNMKEFVFSVDEFPDSSSPSVPIHIQLDEDLGNWFNGVWWYAPKYYFNSTSQFTFFVASEGEGVPSYWTSYMIETGFPRTTMTDSGKGYYTSTLSDGIMFDQLSEDDLIIGLYVNDTFYINITVQKYSGEENNNFDIASEGFSGDYLRPLGFFVLLFFSIAMGMIFKKDIGIHTYLIGGIFLVLIHTSFFGLAIINSLYYGMLLIKGVWSE